MQVIIFFLTAQDFFGIFARAVMMITPALYMLQNAELVFERDYQQTELSLFIREKFKALLGKVYSTVSTINFLDSRGHVGFLVIFNLEIVHTLEVLQPSPAHANPEHNSTTVPSYQLQPAILGIEVVQTYVVTIELMETSLVDYEL